MMKAILSVALVAAAFPAMAAAPQSADSDIKDPNRKVCETVEVTGSRLGGHRVCMTAQQWEDQRRAQREDVQRAQQNSGIKNGN